MNCYNQEFMFGRDFVGCVMRKVWSDWEDPNFHFGEKEGSPFTDYLDDAVQFIVQERYNDYTIKLRSETEHHPLTTVTYSNIMNDKLDELMMGKPGELQRHMDFFLYVAVGASFFFESCQSKVCVVAADIIAKCIFDLELKGCFDESVWMEYEDEIDYFTEILED